MVFVMVALEGFGFFFLPEETALMEAAVDAAAIPVWVCAWGLGVCGLGQASEQTRDVIGSAIFVAFVILFVIGWFYFRRHEDDLEKASGLPRLPERFTHYPRSNNCKLAPTSAPNIR